MRYYIWLIVFVVMGRIMIVIVMMGVMLKGDQKLIVIVDG